MKLNVVFVAVLLIVTSCVKNKKSTELSELDLKNSISQSERENELELEIYDFEGFKKFLSLKDDKVHVINFWATWCAPCVKELPYFEQLNADYHNNEVEVMLVSLDFPHLYDKKLKPFIKEKKLSSKVIALDDADMNSWIPQVSENWSGSIPATVIYKNDKMLFYEQSFTYEELETEVKQFIN
jgi:thiol-disulfide isomerase/thioredoxin